MNLTPQKSKFGVLVSGTLSGLGRYIFEELGDVSWNRQISKPDKEEIKIRGAKVIVHCAVNSSRDVNSGNLYQYFEDNVLLTSILTSVPHKKFIFISSVDVYPKIEKKLSLENEVIDVSKVVGAYAFTKLMSESIVKKNCSNYLILRCSSLLGKYARKNSLIQIMESRNCFLTLSGRSKMNYVLTSDILDFIKLAIKNDLQGTYNVSSSSNITLFQVARIFKRKVNFGNFTYNVGNVENSKLVSIYPIFKKTSKQTIDEFINQINSK